MPKKTVLEMSAFERTHYSIGGKTFRAIILFSFIISIAAISFGYFLYTDSVRREFRTRASQMAKTAAELIDTDEACQEAEHVISIYQTMSEEEKSRLQDKQSPLLSIFDGIRGDGFDKICDVLRLVQENNGGKAAFTAFLDPETKRRVFVTDSDPNQSFCPPGSLDVMDDSVISDLIEGNASLLDQFYGTKPLHATVIHMEPYGYRCMAGAFLKEIDGYPFYIFFDVDMNQAAKSGRSFFWQFVALMVLITAAVVFFAVRRMKRTVVQPINALAEAAKRYISDRADIQRDGEHFANLQIKTGDEIENLCLTMKAMEEDLAFYVKNLTRSTAERERISTELNLANKIQAAMMPHVFPPFPDREEIDLYAVMDPAKEVGGDFYDYFMVDDDHLCIVIADVSGKGVPAALFMMASKIIIQSCAMLGQSAADILTKTNEAICSNNQQNMFVTVWLGILELSTGKLVAANAGHEYPVLKKPDGSFQIIRDKHCLVIGGMKGIKYKEYELIMEPGAKLFLYTDGVPEAANDSLHLFGTEQMLQALNQAPDDSPEQLLRHVREAVDRFVEGAEQFDDLTMLCIHYLGCGKKRNNREESPD